MESTEERILHYQRGIDRSVAVLDKPRLLHCIKALSKLPVTMKHLKNTGIGRTVNSLRKIEEGVGDASKKLVTKWKEMVSNAPDSGESDEACVPDDPDNYESVNYEQEYADDGDDSAAVQSDSYNGINRPEALDRPALSPPMVIDVNVSPEQEPAPNLSEEEEEPDETNYSQSMKHSSSKDKDSKKDSKSSSSSRGSESKDKKESLKVPKSSKDNGHEEHKKKDKDKSKSSSSSSKKHSSEVKKRKVEESSEDDESSRKKQRLSVCENESEDEDDDDEEANNFVIDDDDERNGQSSSDERDNNEATEKSGDASSLKHSDSKSKSKDKRSNSSSSSSKSKSKKDDKHKSKSSSHSSSNGKDKEKHSKSKDDEKGKTKEKKEHKKSKEHKEKKKAKKSAVEGIDSTTGTSFADALGMCSMPPPKKKKEKESSSKTSSKGEQSSPSKSKVKIEQRPVSPSEDSPEDSLRLLSPNVKLEPLSGDINEEVDLASTLPEPSPYYKPLPQVNIAQRRADEEDMLTIAINNKVQRTKVYSGNKSGWTNVPTLQEICIRVLIENIDALEYTGGVPYDILQPILERASADQLQRLEYYNPYLVEETDLLWKFHCNKIFKTKQREEMESWRDMYERCVSEREAKFKAITANIKQSIDKSTPVRSTKLAYVDHFVKPPRNVLRQQAKYGTAKVATSASDLKKKLITGAAGPSSSGSGSLSTSSERISVPPPPPLRSRPPSSHPIKKAKAPLMAKALQAIKGRYKR